MRVDTIDTIKEDYQPDIFPDENDTALYVEGFDDGYKQGHMDALKERKTGKWVKVYGFVTPGGDPVWCCSECGRGLHVYGIEHRTYGADVADGQWVACPNCGALMIGEE